MAGHAFLRAFSGNIRTTTGTQDFTISGIGTPKGCIILVGGNDDDEVDAASVQCSIGFSDGTDHACIGWASEDNLADGNTSRVWSFAACVDLPNYNGSGPVVVSRSATMITDGVRLDFNVVDGIAHSITVIFICGPDASCKVGKFNMADHTGSPNQTLDVTGHGFDPNLVFFGGCFAIAGLNESASNYTTSATYSLGIGCLDDASTVRTLLTSWSHRDTRASGQPSFYSESGTQGAIFTSFVGAATGALTKVGTVNLDAFITDGFRVKDVPGADPPAIVYLAINLNGVSVNTAVWDSPTSDTQVNVAFTTKPGSVFLMGTSADALGDKTDTQQSGNSFGFASQYEQGSMSFWEEDAQATMNNGSISSWTKALLLRESDGTNGLGCVLVNFADSQVEFSSWDTVYGSARKQLMLVIKRPFYTLFPSGIASEEAFGTATITPGSVTVSPSGIASAEAFGTAVVQPGAVTLSPSGIASEEAFGTPALTVGAVTVSPTGIASDEAFGTAVLTATITVSPTGIPSEEAFGTPVLTPGAVTVSPTGIASTEAFGTPSLTPGAVTVSPSGIASEEAFGTPTVLDQPIIFPPSIASEEAFGTATILPGSVTILPGGIASEEAFGTPTVSLNFDITLFVEGIASEEAFGFPFVRGGFIPVTLKKKIRDALVEAAQLGTFIEVTYDQDLNEIQQGLQVAPQSIEANELTTRFKIEDAFGRKFVQDRQFWNWLLVLRFQTEVIAERFERALEDTPICIKRDATEDRQVHVLLVDAQYTHPPRQNPSNGTVAQYRFQAELSRR